MLKPKKILQFLQKLFAHFLILCIRLIRPILGPMNICPYTIGCTQYAIMQLQQNSLLIALKNIWDRIIQCHPFGNRKL